MIIGIVGAIAAGKSTVVNRLAYHGCPVIDADAITHQVLVRPDVIEQMRARWRVRSNYGGVDVSRGVGMSTRPKVIDMMMCGGTFVRSAIADMVFENPKELHFLEKTVDPYIFQEIERLKNFYNNGQHFAVVMDVPLMFEKNDIWLQCDKFIFVVAEEKKRQERYSQRIRERKVDAIADLQRREKLQMTIDEKVRLVDSLNKEFIVISNNTSLDDTNSQVDQYFNILIKREQYFYNVIYGIEN